jgi:hypothetical protein
MFLHCLLVLLLTCPQRRETEDPLEKAFAGVELLLLEALETLPEDLAEFNVEELSGRS